VEGAEIVDVFGDLEPPFDDGEYEEEEEGEQEDELIDVNIDVTTTTKAKKRAAGTRGLRWKPLEDLCLIDAWKEVSFCPITGTNQTVDKFYKRILVSFNEKKNYGEFATIHMDRNEGALSHRWNTIKAACSKFHGYHETIVRRKESGKTTVDWLMDALDMFKNQTGKNFDFMHCFKKLQG
jgi:hypothetical protein